MIYIITHKLVRFCDYENYVPLFVGACINDYSRIQIENCIYDNLGDNISEKNKSFCELTGLYWIWKNDKASEVAGMVHYRRYLKDINSGKRKVPITEESMRKILMKYDMILPKKEKFPASVGYAYRMMHYAKDLEVTRNVIVERHSEYLNAFDEIMNGRELHICNIMVCRKPLFDEYCEWLFDILFEVERRIDISDYDSRQKRVFGYLAERLLNVWVMARRITVRELEMYNTEKNLVNTIKGKIYKFMRYVLHIDIYEVQINRRFKFYHGQ